MSTNGDKTSVRKYKQFKQKVIGSLLRVKPYNTGLIEKRSDGVYISDEILFVCSISTLHNDVDQYIGLFLYCICIYKKRPMHWTTF